LAPFKRFNRRDHLGRAGVDNGYLRGGVESLRSAGDKQYPLHLGHAALQSQFSKQRA
jgi:hypothetical protein